jgi:hypothetical protein
MQTRSDLEDLEVVVRRRDANYVARIPQLGLYAAADSLPKALEKLQVKKEGLLDELTAAGALDEIQVVHLGAATQSGLLSALVMFLAKAVIVLALFLAATSFVSYTIQRQIEHSQLNKFGTAMFWDRVEASLARASDPANDLPAARKQALLAELHIVVDLWRPFVREAGRLFSDQETPQAGNP